MLTIRLDTAVPLSEQLVKGLRAAIASGELSPGDPLPTVRQLAADLGIHMNTVARAYQGLEACGLVHSTRGRGTRVAADRERPRAPLGQVRAGLAERLRSLLADARLAGLDRAATRQLIDRSLEEYWPQEETS